MTETSSFVPVSTRCQRIAALAKQSPTMALTSLNHHLDMAWLHRAVDRTRADGATGVDGIDGQDYQENLRANLRSLLNRAKSGTYRAPPVRRVHIPKGTGKETRPIGIPTFEDKVLQRAVAMLLEPIYEQDFCDSSYGFRPGRSAHDALAAIRSRMTQFGGGWILEVDIRKFFDELDHGHLREFVQRRVRDGVVLRLLGKWLKAGVMEGGQIRRPHAGSPQGGVISPLLANIYLHYVLDEWFAKEVQPRLRGRSFLVRYADDFVIGFRREDDARRVLEVLPKRMGRFGLRLHPDKTRLVRFKRPPRGRRRNEVDEAKRPGSFDMLGFTHYWCQSRRGVWVIKQKTSSSRFARAVRAVSLWCRRHRHRPIPEQHAGLCQKLRGHCAYFGITGNSGSLARFYLAVIRTWKKWLTTRHRKHRKDWQWFTGLLARHPLPRPIAVRSVLRQRSEWVT